MYIWRVESLQIFHSMIHTLHEKIAFSLLRNCIPAKDMSYSNCSFGKVTVKLTIIYEVGERNL